MGGSKISTPRLPTGQHENFQISNHFHFFSFWYVASVTFSLGRETWIQWSWCLSDNMILKVVLGLGINSSAQKFQVPFCSHFILGTYIRWSYVAKNDPSSSGCWNDLSKNTSSFLVPSACWVYKYIHAIEELLTHWVLNNLVEILKTFLCAFSWMKMFEFWFQFHQNMPKPLPKPVLM